MLWFVVIFSVLLSFPEPGVQVAQFEDVKFEAASLLSELYCQQVTDSQHNTALMT